MIKNYKSNSGKNIEKGRSNVLLNPKIIKYLFTAIVLVFSNFSYSQKPGSAGTLLKNESSVGGSLGNLGDAGIFGQKSTKNVKNYQWKSQFGNSEIFIRIPEGGYFTVVVDDQEISNHNGRFRFYEVAAGQVRISVYDRDILLYQSSLNVKASTRFVLDFFTDEGLFLLKTLPIRSVWDDVWNSPYGNVRNVYYDNVMNDRAFAEFYNAYKNSGAFDDNRTQFIAQQIKHTSFTSRQIYELVALYDFDQKRLAAAKTLYSKCVDRYNFYKVYDAFKYDIYKRELAAYVAKN